MSGLSTNEQGGNDRHTVRGTPRSASSSSHSLVSWLACLAILIGLGVSAMLFRFLNAEANKHRHALAGDLLTNECIDVDRLNALLSHRLKPSDYTPLVPYEQNLAIPPIGFRVVAHEVLGGRESSYHALPFWTAWGTGGIGLVFMAGHAWRVSKKAATGDHR